MPHRSWTRIPRSIFIGMIPRPRLEESNINPAHSVIPVEHRVVGARLDKAALESISTHHGAKGIRAVRVKLRHLGVCTAEERGPAASTSALEVHKYVGELRDWVLEELVRAVETILFTIYPELVI